jgi:hypothetical protein
MFQVFPPETRSSLLFTVCCGPAVGLLLFDLINHLVSYLQPQPQPYGKFPATHGQAASFFMNSGVRSGDIIAAYLLNTGLSYQVQQEFAFIPDDGSATYVINVEVS